MQALRTIKFNASTTEINIIYGATINPDLGEDLIVTVIATGFDETNATAKPVEMLISDNRNKKHQHLNQSRKHNHRLNNQNHLNQNVNHLVEIV